MQPCVFGMTDTLQDVKQSCYYIIQNLMRTERHYQRESYQLTSPFKYKFLAIIFASQPNLFPLLQTQKLWYQGKGEERSRAFIHTFNRYSLRASYYQALTHNSPNFLGLRAGIRIQVMLSERCCFWNVHQVKIFKNFSIFFPQVLVRKHNNGLCPAFESS